MVSAQPTRKVVKMLRNAGFTRIRTVGSHSVWSKGQTTVSLPDGHRRISPEVFRQVEKAIEEARA